jgi:glycosyltransferase involved in cell wall biosynthesis
LKEIQGILFSIIVITYNSSKYVLDTLESCKRQSYKNIELIISDDCSTDDTFKICQQWLNENDKFFKKTKLIKADSNLGTTNNCRRGLEASSGEWVKLIAGDDILFDNAIESVYNFCINSKNNKLACILSMEIRFSLIDDKSTYFPAPGNMDLLHPFFKGSAFIQFQFLLLGKFISGASMYYKSSVLKNNSIFNDNISKFVEDYLAAIYLTSLNYRIEFLKYPTVFYRKNNQGITGNQINFFPNYFIDVVKIRTFFLNNVSIPFLLHLAIKFDIYFYKLIFKLGNSGKLCQLLFNLNNSLGPTRIYSSFLKKYHDIFK